MHNHGAVSVAVIGDDPSSNDRRLPAGADAGLRDFFDWLPFGVFRSSPSGQILDVNLALVKMLKFPSAAALMTRHKELYADAADRGRWQKLVERDGSVRGFEMQLRRADGQLVWVSILARAVRDTGGGIRYYEGVLFPVGGGVAGRRRRRGVARHLTEQIRATEVLRRFNDNLEQQAKGIAQALHDEAAQILTSVHIALADAGRDLPPSARERLRDVKGHIERIEVELRRLAHELRPRILDDLGLVPALEFLAVGVEKRWRIKVVVHAALRGRLPYPIETALYRLSHEALSNASRHARAANVAIRLVQDHRMLRCTIADDGIGFDPHAVLAPPGDQGFGLWGIRERVTALGGTILIESAPGQGTNLIVEIPLEG